MTSDVRLEEDYKLSRYVCVDWAGVCLCEYLLSKMEDLLL